jgi:hypothetical protein
VDAALVGVDEAIVSTGDVDAALASVDVVATCANTGLTMANQITSARTTALIPIHMMLAIFITVIILINLFIALELRHSHQAARPVWSEDRFQH